VRSRFLSSIAAALALSLAVPARADERARTRFLSATPDAPAFSLAWQGALRGTLGAEIPLVEEPRAFVLLLVPFVELQNTGGDSSPLPNRFWRGRLSIESWWSVRRDWTIGVSVEHESNHATSRWGSTAASLQTNDVAFRTAWSFPPRSAAVAIGTDLRFLVWSCTNIDNPCEDYRGSTSFAPTAWAVVEVLAWRLGPWAPFASVDASMLAPHGYVLRERRIVLQAGVAKQSGLGNWKLFGFAFAGNEVGIERGTNVERLGFGLSWAPR